jgi:hypothetical protein
MPAQNPAESATLSPLGQEEPGQEELGQEELGQEELGREEEKQWQAKQILYTEVYSPFTRSWFAALHRSKEKQALILDAHDRGLTATVERFNELFHELADVALHEAGTATLLEVVKRHKEHVLWVGDEDPGDSPGDRAIHDSMVAKLYRNISLGVLEALLCLESAYVFLSEVRGMRGQELSAALRRSKALYGSLAVLHDADERERVMWLTGRNEAVEFPQVSFDDIFTGRVRISADKFMISDSANPPRLRFVKVATGEITHSTPTMRCPAHRAAPDGGTYNDSMWHLLIDIYQHAGRFDNR